MAEALIEKEAAIGVARWASLAAEAVLNELGTTSEGLTERQAAQRLAHHGPNVLPRPQPQPWYREFAATITHFFALLLWAGAIFAWIAGMRELAVAIVAVVLINGVFSYWQEYHAKRAVEELESLLPHEAIVKRGGREVVIPASDVVCGDVLVLTEGEAVSADARLLRAEALRLDTSAMTGESRPAPRSAAPADPTGRTVVMLPNIVMAGATVVSGRGEAAVFATGSATEFGRIARLTGVQLERPSPLEIELARVTRIVTALAMMMGVLFFGVGTLLGDLSWTAAFLFAVGIIVANVPEGLLPTLTLALALGVRRMASRKALVKRLSAVEALGAATIILTDKTGTLTENQMAVCELWIGGRVYTADELKRQTAANLDPTLTDLFRTAALCCDARFRPRRDGKRGWETTGDPTETAILTTASDLGLTPEQLAGSPRVGELPFDSVRKRMTTIQRIGAAEVACVKGAASEVFPRCSRACWGGADAPFDEALRREAEKAQHRLAGKGMRVLAVARRALDAEPLAQPWQPDQVEKDLTLVGLLALEDPPRPEVPAAIALCRRAGVRVVMVTGDDGLTAAAIGREIGICEGHPRIVTGAELDRMDAQHIERLFDTPNLLFARVSPEHKLALVQACQRRGDVVAVTGDGVNDAPALKRADIGIAMGETGTDVARAAADMVLADDNFASIVAAIEQGRAVYDNVRKFVTYIFASNVPEVVPFIAFVLFRIPLPLTVMQILAVDLGTDLLPALALGAEPPEPDVMQRPPRKRSEPLLDAKTLGRAYGWLGVIEAALCMTCYYAGFWLSGWRPGSPLPSTGGAYITATTMSLAGIVACQVGNAFACRTRTKPALRLGLFSNPLLPLGISAELALLTALIYLPPLAAVFGLSPLEPRHWLLLTLPGPVLVALEETRKFLARRLAQPSPA